jgi:hypothetical protein
MTPVTIIFGPLPANYCPSNPQELISTMNRIATGYVRGTNERVRVEFGFVVPPFCPETPQAFIDGLNSVARGYVESTGVPVHIEFSLPAEFCWTDPFGILAQLLQTVTAYTMD